MWLLRCSLLAVLAVGGCERHDTSADTGQGFSPPAPQVSGLPAEDDAQIAAMPLPDPVPAGGSLDNSLLTDVQPEIGSVEKGSDPESAPVAESDTAPPARPSAPDAVPEFRPLLTAREGDWALYQALHGRAIRYEVVETGTRTKTRVTLYAEGKPLGQPAVREDPADTDHLALQAARFDAVRTAVRCTVTAAGREWSATRYEDRWMDEDEVHYVRRTWVSPEAPVFGIIRMELHGSLEPGPSEATLEALLELEAYGNARSSD